MRKQWDKYPPAHISIAHYLGFANTGRAGESGDVADFHGALSEIELTPEEFDAMARELGL
jgi:hypothetical protein